jgi:hypothetical protein
MSPASTPILRIKMSEGRFILSLERPTHSTEIDFHESTGETYGEDASRFVPCEPQASSDLDVGQGSGKDADKKRVGPN